MKNERMQLEINENTLVLKSSDDNFWSKNGEVNFGRPFVNGTQTTEHFVTGQFLEDGNRIAFTSVSGKTKVNYTLTEKSLSFEAALPTEAGLRSGVYFPLNFLDSTADDKRPVHA